MKISHTSKARAYARTALVLRPVHETYRNYRWWLFQDTEPALGYIEERCTYFEAVHPRVAGQSSRKPKLAKLSRGALRKRLYRNNVPRSLWPELIGTYSGHGLIAQAGERSVKALWGYSVGKAVTRHLRTTIVFMDEFWHYNNPIPVTLMGKVREARKVNSDEATQA